MSLYANDPATAELLFNVALASHPEDLSAYRVLYKFYNRLRRFDAALEMALRGLEQAAKQSGLPLDWRLWSEEMVSEAPRESAAFALLSLKAMAFIELRMGNQAMANAMLEKLRELDPEDGTGGSVVAALAEGLQGE